jgi:hypothetical protein
MPWQDRLFEILKNEGINIFSYVPDAGHKILIDRALSDNSIIAMYHLHQNKRELALLQDLI